MIDFLYIFNFSDTYFSKAMTRFHYAINSIIRQDVKIVVINYSVKCIQDKIQKLGKLEYHHFPSTEYFNKPRCINYAVKNYIKSDYFIFSDIDLINPPNYIQHVCEKLNVFKDKKIRMIPFNYNMYKEIYTDDISELLKHPRHYQGGFAHGNGLIHLPSFMDVRGYDEFYKGYGPEDDDFNQRIGKINTLVYDKDICTYHLFHEQMDRKYEEENRNYYRRALEKLNKVDGSNLRYLQPNPPEWGDRPR